MAATGSRLTADDLFLFNEGTHFRLYDKLGAHPATVAGKQGVTFAVFAPNAQSVAVVGDFNAWKDDRHPMARRADSGVWEAFVPGVKEGALYKFHIVSKYGGYTVDKTDPFARFHEAPPRLASIVASLDYAWGDAAWLKERKLRQALDAPISIYEVHLGSWMRHQGDNRHFTYREIAPRLVEYVRETGYTHVELLPVLEHPFYGSWGYQTTGYFAPTSRYGPPQDFMFLVDSLHQAGVGVFLDWVPAHFPSDETALGYFDGTWLFEHADPRQGFHPDWKSLIFNYGRPEVQSFLVSSALFWIDRYHVDGLRVDAVASMLYLDYSRKDGEWVANVHGGRENLEAIAFLRKLNEAVYREFPGAQTIAEESTSWPMVSRPSHLGGLGFGLKWDMGWMHDTLAYFSADPIFRKFMQHNVTFRTMYSDAENFVLSLSHDEVVHGKRSLLMKMAGDEWQRFANLRLLFAWMHAQNGKKLLFMGSDFGQVAEWDHERELDWRLLDDPRHAGIRRLVARLNAIYREFRCMHELDHQKSGFEWVDCVDADRSVVALLRNAKQAGDQILCAFNFTPVPRPDSRFGVTAAGAWRVLLDTDAPEFGGSGFARVDEVESEPVAWHGRPQSIKLALPPLGALFLRYGRRDGE